jgi:hypothetical protein
VINTGRVSVTLVFGPYFSNLHKIQTENCYFLETAYEFIRENKQTKLIMAKI